MTTPVSDGRKAAIDARRGFVLPMVLIFLVVLSAAVAAAFTYVAAESGVSDSRQSEQDALLVAQAGLAAFAKSIPAAARDSMFPAVGAVLVASDSSVTALLPLDVSDRRLRRVSGGTLVPDTAAVKAFIVRRPANARDSSLWLLRTRGVASRALAANTPTVERTISMYAWFVPGRMNVLGGWVSLTGADRTGNAGTYSGVDACGADSTKFAIVVPNDPGANYTGSLSGMSGMGLDSARNIATLAAKLNIDWAALSTGSGMTPDFVVDVGAGVSALPTAMCLRFSLDTTYAPTILVKNAGLAEYDYASLCSGAYMNVKKRGVLIVAGDFRMTGATGGDWGGVILIGEKFRSNGTQDVNGAVVSGLRATIDPTFRTPATLDDESALLLGTKNYKYDSCAVRTALKGFGGLRPMQNTYSDQSPQG